MVRGQNSSIIAELNKLTHQETKIVFVTTWAHHSLKLARQLKLNAGIYLNQRSIIRKSQIDQNHHSKLFEYLAEFDYLNDVGQITQPPDKIHWWKYPIVAEYLETHDDNAFWFDDQLDTKLIELCQNNFGEKLHPCKTDHDVGLTIDLLNQIQLATFPVH